VQVNNYKARKSPRLLLHQGYMPTLRPFTELLTAGAMDLALSALTDFLPHQAH
jgi:hypothetical protein